MFTFKFFRSLSQQRRLFLEATEFTTPQIFPEVQKILNNLETENGYPLPKTAVELWKGCFKSIFSILRLSIIFQTISALVILLGVFSLQLIVDPNKSLLLAISCCVVFFSTRITKAIIDYQDNIRRAQMHRGIQAYLFAVINSKLLNLDSEQFTKGELKTLIGSDIDAIEDFLNLLISQGIPSLIAMIVITPALIYLLGWVGLLAILLSFGSIVIASIGGIFIEKLQTKAQQQQDKLTTVIGEWLQNVRTIRFMGWQSAIETEINDKMKKYCSAYAFRHAVSILIFSLTHTWWMVPIIGILLVTKSTNITEIFSAVWILDALNRYVMLIPLVISSYGAAVAGATRIIALNNEPDVTTNFIKGERYNNLGEPIAIKLSDVTLKFGNKTIINNVSIRFLLNKKNIILGKVGSGKSSLLKLIIGEIAPTSGTITVEFTSGISANLWEDDIYLTIRKYLAYSPQQPYLSNATIRENIGFGNSGDLDSAINHALLTFDISQFTLGVEEEVGEIGINLSGGQKHRVSLARAFFSKRPFYIMDDPLSSVDIATEKELFTSLINNSSGFIMATHRLNNIVECDRITVITEGIISEDSTVQNLHLDLNVKLRDFLTNNIME
jgi:ABC-type multidrug transport system fused ATPase/permease subunit